MQGKKYHTRILHLSDNSGENTYKAKDREKKNILTVESPSLGTTVSPDVTISSQVSHGDILPSKRSSNLKKLQSEYLEQALF